MRPPRDQSPRNARSSPRSSATSSGSPRLLESADPEDVDRMLAAYFAMARNQIEGHGGVVEKFIGDAVVGVFGVPAAHEDDPERAVRAGLRIAEDAEELTSIGGEPLKLRVGINTGEALVRFDVTAASGEGFLAGDAINTASRIQSVAPRDGRRGRPRHLRGDDSGLRLRRTGARDAEGQVGTGAGLPREGPTSALRHRSHPYPRLPLHRTRDRPGDAQGHRSTSRLSRRVGPARHRRRRTGDRQEPDRRRARGLHR